MNAEQKRMLGLKIAVCILYALATVFVISFIPDILKNINGDNAQRFGAAIGLVIMLIYGIISYAPAFVLSVVGSVVSFVRYRNKVVSKGTMLFFILSIGVEIISVVGIYLFVLLVA